MSGWLGRLRRGLGKSTNQLTGGISRIFTGRRLDADALTELEDLLITADVGVATSAKLAAALGAKKLPAEATEADIRAALAHDVAAILEPVARPLTPDPAHRPHVILMVGVNGTGKTTTIGKLAQQYRAAGKSVVLAAADTFRAAAIEQLQLWGERTGCPVVAGEPGGDPAAVAFQALERAQADAADVLLVDTAGRLHNKADLMAQLQKVVRVLGKRDATAPHDTVLVLDATTGQNAHAQLQTFQDLVAVTGLVVTKLDGSARGGVIVGLADRFAVPIHAIGVGETADDLRPFDAGDFAASLLGLDAAA